MSIEGKFVVAYNVTMENSDHTAVLTLKCDEKITTGVFLDCLEQIIEDYVKMTEDNEGTH